MQLAERVPRAAGDAARRVPWFARSPRAAALSDEELARIAAEFDKLPAGGNPGIVFLVYAFAYAVALLIYVPIKLIAHLVEEGRKSQ